MSLTTKSVKIELGYRDDKNGVAEDCMLSTVNPTLFLYYPYPGTYLRGPNNHYTVISCIYNPVVQVGFAIV